MLAARKENERVDSSNLILLAFDDGQSHFLNLLSFTFPFHQTMSRVATFTTSMGTFKVRTCLTLFNIHVM
jgi:hypothetical protein